MASADVGTDVDLAHFGVVDAELEASLLHYFVN